MNLIKADLYRHDGQSGLGGLVKALFTNPGFRYTYLLRKAGASARWSLHGLVYRALRRRYSFKYGYQINPQARIGEGFFLSGHRGSVVIGPVTIGKNCNVNHGVTIGTSVKDGVEGLPTIGDFVWIGTGAVVVGPITIGSNVLIAPNAFVSSDVPDNCLVVGNPGRILKNDNPTRDRINHVITDTRGTSP
jgi:serine O-acetyltransferase